MKRVDEGTRSRLLNIRGWRGFNNPWMPVDEEDVDFSYINLQQNPERYTGYKVRDPPRLRCRSLPRVCHSHAGPHGCWSQQQTCL